MTDDSNDYDNDPPPPPEEALGDSFGGSGRGPGRPNNIVRECMDWLGTFLAKGAIKASEIADEAERKGFSERTLYRAKSNMKLVVSSGFAGKKWGLAAEDDEPIPE